MENNESRKTQTAPVARTETTSSSGGVLGGGVRQTAGFVAMTPQPFNSMPTPQYTYSMPEFGDEDPYRPPPRPASASSNKSWDFQSQAPSSAPSPAREGNNANEDSDGHNPNHMFHDLLPQNRQQLAYAAGLPIGLHYTQYPPTYQQPRYSAVPGIGINYNQPPNMGMGMGMRVGLGMRRGSPTGMGMNFPQEGPAPGYGMPAPQYPQMGAGVEYLKEQEDRAKHLVALIKAGGIIYDDDADDDRSNYTTSSRRGQRRRNTTQGRGCHGRGSSKDNGNGNGLARHQSMHGPNPIRNMPSIQESPILNTPAPATPVTIQNPTWLYAAMNGKYKPTYNELTTSLPFMEPRSYLRPTTSEVIRIKNIPFTATRSEILSCIGNRARVIPMPQGSGYFAVHVVMERMSGKTMDAYIELEDAQEVRAVITQYERRLHQRRPVKIGDRIIEIERSSQRELMKELFPRAKCVTWYGTEPVIGTTTEEYRPGVFASGFHGFLTSEEMVMTAKHAEVPQRSPYAQRSLNRTYESMISTLHKYPWLYTDNITLGERKALYNTTRTLIRTLMKNLLEGRNDTSGSLTPQLLQELTMAALSCAGFNEGQKFDIVATLHRGGFGEFATTRGHAVRFGGVHPYASVWPFTLLALKPGVSGELIEYFATLMCNGPQNLSLAEFAASRAAAEQDPRAGLRPFGKVSIDYGKDTAALTMSAAARKEWDYLEGFFRSSEAEDARVAALRSAFTGMRT